MAAGHGPLKQSRCCHVGWLFILKMFPIKLRKRILTSVSLILWLFAYSVRFQHVPLRRKPGSFLIGFVRVCVRFNYGITDNCSWQQPGSSEHDIIRIQVSMLAKSFVSWNHGNSYCNWHTNKATGLGHKHEVESWFVNTNDKMKTYFLFKSDAYSLWLQTSQSLCTCYICVRGQISK